MSTEYNPPGEISSKESTRHQVDEEIDPETLAVTLVQHAYDTEPEPQKYLTRVVAELFGAEPAVLDHVVAKRFTDLTEELGRRGQQDAVRVVLEVQSHWEQES